MPHPSTRRRVYRPDVDGLRAIAVLAVVLNHLDLGLPGGYVGVDIFFVISGWLITSNIVADIRSDSFSLRTFWSRRVRRLFPALFVVSLTTLIAGAIYLRPSLYEPLGLSLVYQSLLLSNHFFYTQTDYFAPAAEATPMLHVWSLAVEEQFYLLFPLIFYRRAGWSSADATQRVTAIVGVSFLLSIFMTWYDTQAAFFLLPYRIWELGAGAILALVNPPTMLRKRAVIESLSLVASLACLLPCLAYDDNWPFPGLSALPIITGTTALIWLQSGHRTLVGRTLSAPPLVALGRASYSIYLWHWPILSIATLGWHLDGHCHTRIGLLCVCIALGFLSWRFIETPWRAANSGLSDWQTIYAAIAGQSLLLGCGAFIVVTGGWPERLPESLRRMVAVETAAPFFDSPETVSGYNSLPWLGDRTQIPTLLLWGDSHAQVVYPLLDAMAEAYHVSGVAATRAGVLPAATDEVVMRFIQDCQISEVILVARWEHQANKMCNAGEYRTISMLPVDGQERRAFYKPFEDNLTKTVRTLRERGLRVWIMKQVPEYAFDVPNRLLNGLDATKGGVTRDEHKRLHGTLDRIIDGMSAYGATVLDPAPIFFRDGDTAVVLIDGVSAYRDSDHLTTVAAERLLRPLFDVVFTAISQARNRTSERTQEAGQ